MKYIFKPINKYVANLKKQIELIKETDTTHWYTSETFNNNLIFYEWRRATLCAGSYINKLNIA